MLNRFRNSFRKGDTLVEVMFAVGIFGLAAVGAISLMNRGLATAQNTLEITLARQEIDTQAEVLRFLHSAYYSTHGALSDNPCTEPKSYRDIWKCIATEYTYTYDEITSPAGGNDPDFYTRTNTTGMNCDELFRLGGTTAFSIPAKSFILNPRSLGITDLENTSLTNIIAKSDLVSVAGTYPRLLYGDGNLSDVSIEENQIVRSDNQKALQQSEGVWVTSVASQAGIRCKDTESETGWTFRPDYYDFHIQTCWDSATGDSASTIGTSIRLFNSDQVQPVKKAITPTSMESMGLYFVLTWKGPNEDFDSYLWGSKSSPTNNNPFNIGFEYNDVAGEEKQFSFTTNKVHTFQLDIDARKDSTGKNYDSSKDSHVGCKEGGQNNSPCGDGYVEVIAFRSLFPAKFRYWIVDYGKAGMVGETDHHPMGWDGNEVKVRVFAGQADEGVGVWPKTKTDGSVNEPIATFEYKNGMLGVGRNWNVVEFEVDNEGNFILQGKTYNLEQYVMGDITTESSCERY